MWGPLNNLFSQFSSGRIKVGYYEKFFQTNYDDLRAAIEISDAWAILTNPFIIAITALLVILFTIKRSRKALALLGAIWSYGFVYHFTLGLHKFNVDILSGDKQMNFAPMIGFFVGMTLVTIVVLYVVFKSD